MRNTNVKVITSEGQREKIQHAIKAGCSAVSIRLGQEDLESDDNLAVTDSQAKKLAKALENGIEGSFPSLLAGLAVRALPLVTKIVLPALGDGALSRFASSEVQKAVEKPPEGEEDTQYIGAVAEKYVQNFATKSEADTTYGLYDRNGNFYIGNKPVVIIDNNIVVDDEEYEGTSGLWELIVSKSSDDNVYTYEDYIFTHTGIRKPTSFIVITTRTAITPKAARGKNGKEY